MVHCEERTAAEELRREEGSFQVWFHLHVLSLSEAQSHCDFRASVRVFPKAFNCVSECVVSNIRKSNSEVE